MKQNHTIENLLYAVTNLAQILDQPINNGDIKVKWEWVAKLINSAQCSAVDAVKEIHDLRAEIEDIKENLSGGERINNVAPELSDCFTPQELALLANG